MGAQILNVEPGHHCPPLATTLRQACNQLGTPGSVKTEEFSERGQHFLNYAQHIYVGGLRPPLWLRSSTESNSTYSNDSSQRD